MHPLHSRLSPCDRVVTWPTAPVHPDTAGIVLHTGHDDDPVLVRFDGIVEPAWVYRSSLRVVGVAERESDTPFYTGQGVIIRTRDHRHGMTAVVSAPGARSTSVHIYGLPGVREFDNDSLDPATDPRDTEGDKEMDNMFAEGDRVTVTEESHPHYGKKGAVSVVAASGATVRFDGETDPGWVSTEFLEKIEDPAPPTGEWVEKFVRDAHELADHHDMCHVVDQFLADHGLPGRRRKYKATIPYSGAVSVIVDAYSEEEAQQTAASVVTGAGLVEMDNRINSLDERLCSDINVRSDQATARPWA